MIYIDDELDFKSLKFLNGKVILTIEDNPFNYNDLIIEYYSSYVLCKYIKFEENSTLLIRYLIGNIYINCEEELIIIPFTTYNQNNKGFNFANFQKWIDKIGDYQPSIYDIETFKSY